MQESNKTYSTKNDITTPYEPPAPSATPERVGLPRVECSEWMDALESALQHWKLYAQSERLDPDWPFDHSDEEAIIFRSCEAVLSRASIEKLSHTAPTTT